MGDSYQKYRFSAISIKKEVADRFREFSREVSPTHTETLEAMLNFFKWNQLSPNDDLGVREDGTKKRINALISIVKSIERDGILPTKAMMEMLFELRPNQDELEEKGKLSMPEPEKIKLDMTFELLREREQRINLEEELDRTKTAFNELLFHRIKSVRTTLGPTRLQVEMTPKEFENLKQQFKTQ
ncbi:BfmA/BtgA family mobilization protein [Flagellimonas olearia]|uniref:Uncharacterized protein n=1 Tax=Flagellimonas olearia TaxID=552546 RepID=A0A444VI38_9FLAO|nr:BfmA/BtgA family mobilization protein [Allomuricauda olearia]RYC50414.1 hypothetical protein DN53_05710 [Allomuricauda olearia]